MSLAGATLAGATLAGATLADATSLSVTNAVGTFPLFLGRPRFLGADADADAATDVTK